jgi:DNA-binding IclR family transcriptional regulator
VLHDTDVVYLQKLPIKGLEVPTRDGGRMPAHCTGLGKAMLAWSPDEQVERVIDTGLERRTATTIVDPAAFRAELAAIRDRGVAYDRDEACPGLSCVAAPIRGSGRAIGAVSVTGFSGRFDFASVELKVRAAAVAIWRDLFGSPRADVA